jgi:hypothetical protein
VRRELSNLLSNGIIVSDNTNNRLYYEVNQKYDFYEPLRAIFGSDKKAVSSAAPKEDKMAATLKNLGNVEMLVYTGQFTRDESTGIDVLVVGDVNTTQLQKYIAELETSEGKELRYTSMSTSDFRYRVQINDKFTATLLEAKKQVIVDKHNLLQPEAKQ